MYTHAVAHRILMQKDNRVVETDELVYAVSHDHAMAIAHQGLAAGWAGIAILELKTPVKDIPDDKGNGRLD